MLRSGFSCRLVDDFVLFASANWLTDWNDINSDMLNRFRLVGLLTLVYALSASFADLRTVDVQFVPYWGDKPFKADSVYFSEKNGDSIRFTQFRFYISDFILHENIIAGAVTDYQLVDLSTGASSANIIQYHSMGRITEFTFNLGIDSATNVNGVGSGMLDPTNGMYWAWHSGFINLKLEGTSPSCTKNRGKFQYHLGGYSAPYNALRQVKLQYETDDEHIRIKVDLKKFIDGVNMKDQAVVMSPGADAMKLSDNAVSMFSILK